MAGNAVVFIGQSFPGKVHLNLANFAVAMRTELANSVDMFFAASGRDSDAGAWDVVRNSFLPDFVLRTTHFFELGKKIAVLFSKYGAIVVHCGGSLPEMRLCRRLKGQFGSRCKVVIITHSFSINTWKRIPNSLVKFFLYSFIADRIVFQTLYTARQFCGGMRLLRTGKAVVIPLGCEEFALAMHNDVNTLPVDLGKAIDGSGFKVVYLANFFPGKGHLQLIEAVEGLLNECNIKLFLCGGGDDSCRQAVVDKIRTLQLEGKIIVSPRIPRLQVPELLRHMDCALVFSRGETFGHAFVEPMMAGLPVIGTRVGIGEGLILDYQTGFGVDVENMSLVCNALRYMVQDPLRVRRMGARAKEIAESMFSYKSVGNAHASLCKDLLNVV